jgi:hypothetical protein
MSGQNSKTRTRAWQSILPVGGGAPGGITQLTGPVTAGPGVGIQASAITPTGVAPGTFGDATHVGAVTVNATGQITGAANVLIPFSSEWYTSERAVGNFWVSDPTFAGGTVGDGVTNDAPAIIAADAAAFARGGGVVLFPAPPVAFLTNSELTPSPGVTWQGNATDRSEYIIRAGVVMRSVLHVQNYTSTLAPTPNRIRGLTIDANGLATNAILSDGDFLSEYERVFAINAVKNGQRSSSISVAPVLSAVAPGGGAPGGVTVSIPDPNYTGFSNSGVKSLVARIVTPGGLGVATYQMSFDGGGTFQAATQLVMATSNISITNGAVYGPWSGVQINFPAQAYPGGGTYSFTDTIAADQSGGGHAINADRRFFDGYWVNNGTVFATAGLAAGYTGSARVVTITGGTVTTTSGSQLIVGAGTSFMSFGAQEGDMWLINGRLFPTATVLDDLTLAVPSTATPTFSLGGLAFAAGVGSGYHEDGNSENVRGMIYGGSAHTNASADFRFAGSEGPVVTQTRNEAYGFAAYVIGSAKLIMSGATLFLHPHVEAGAAGSVSLYNYSVASATAIEPPELWTTAGPGPGYRIINGIQFPTNGGAESLVLSYTEHWVEGNAIALATGAETLPVPTLEATGQPSVLNLAPSANVLMSAAPLFPGAAALPNGVVIKLFNQSAFFSVTLQADRETGSGVVTKGRYVTLGANGFVYLKSFFGVLYQITPEANDHSSASGNPGDISWRPVVVPANGTPFVLWTFNVVNSGTSSGTTIIYDVVARSNGVTNLASWTQFRAMWNVGTPIPSLLADSPGVAMGSGPGGLPPLGWTLSLDFDGANQFGRIILTPDNSGNDLHVNIYVRHISPPT